jgi:hypothetical protein
MQPCAKGTRNGLGPFDKPSSGIDATDAIGITSQSISASVMYVLCATLPVGGAGRSRGRRQGERHLPNTDPVGIVIVRRGLASSQRVTVGTLAISLQPQA